jgi:DNA invertase Pin-like site-specific DNA recombinase
MQTAVIYARYSCDQQTEQSIEGQLRVCEEYAQRNNLLIVDTYIDRAMTGTNDNRPDFQKMIKDSAKHKWNYVIVYKLDRFSRDKYATAIHKKTLRDNGVKVLSAMENIPDSPEGIILESLLEGMNQYYSAELSQKVRRGMKETRLKGNYQGGGLPYGYKADGCKVVIDEDKVDTVKFIFDQYAKGVYVRDIINSLTMKGILNKGKPFAQNTVYGILKNEKYLGRYMHGDELVDNIYPQIIDENTFNKVRVKTQANHKGSRSVQTVYLLRGKLKCGYCGNSVIAECGKDKHGERHYYYKCHGRKNLKNGCTNPTIRKEVLEEIIINCVIESLADDKNINAIVKGILKAQEQTINANTTLAVLQRELKQVEESLNNIVAAIEKGIISNITTKRLHELEERQQELERLIAIEKSKVEIKITEKEIKLYYETALKLEPQMLIEYLIKEIKLYEDKIEVIFNSPINTSPDESQGFIFYEKTIKVQRVEQYSIYTEASRINIILRI